MKHQRKFDEQNERLKHSYMKYLAHAKGYADTTLRKVAEALIRFERAIDFKSFKNLAVSDAEKFKDALDAARNKKTGEPIAATTRVNSLVQVRSFVHWLADQPGYKTVIRHTLADYFAPSNKDLAIARSGRLIPSATGEQAIHAFKQMPSKTVDDRRDRAVFALMMLTGARIAATASLKIGHVDLKEGCVFQDAADVATKFSKTFTTWFLPVEQEYLDCLSSWIQELRKTHLFGPSDPLFPKPRIKVSPGIGFERIGLSHDHYSSENTLRKIIKSAFAAAGLPPFTPHRFRNTIVRMSNDFVTTAEELKAVSMNLGHSRISTTIDDYGRISPERQGEVMKKLRERVQKSKTAS